MFKDALALPCHCTILTLWVSRSWKHYISPASLMTFCIHGTYLELRLTWHCLGVIQIILSQYCEILYIDSCRNLLIDRVHKWMSTKYKPSKRLLLFTIATCRIPAQPTKEVPLKPCSQPEARFFDRTIFSLIPIFWNRIRFY